MESLLSLELIFFHLKFNQAGSISCVRLAFPFVKLIMILYFYLSNLLKIYFHLINFAEIVIFYFIIDSQKLSFSLILDKIFIYVIL